MLALIRELKASGMTMVIATHEMGFAREVADRVCFLDGGLVSSRARRRRSSASRASTAPGSSCNASPTPAGSEPTPAGCDYSGAGRRAVGYGAAMTTTTHALIAQAAMPAARKRTERRALVR